MDHRLNMLLFHATITTFIRMQTFSFGTAVAQAEPLINVSEIDPLVNVFFPRKESADLASRNKPVLIKGLKTRVFRI